MLIQYIAYNCIINTSTCMHMWLTIDHYHNNKIGRCVVTPFGTSESSEVHCFVHNLECTWLFSQGTHLLQYT